MHPQELEADVPPATAPAAPGAKGAGTGAGTGTDALSPVAEDDENVHEQEHASAPRAELDHSARGIATAVDPAPASAAAAAQRQRERGLPYEKNEIARSRSDGSPTPAAFPAGGTWVGGGSGRAGQRMGKESRFEERW